MSFLGSGKGVCDGTHLSCLLEEVPLGGAWRKPGYSRQASRVLQG